MPSYPTRWKIVYSNADVEFLNDLGFLRSTVQGDFLIQENHRHEVKRTFVMKNIRSWEAVE